MINDDVICKLVPNVLSIFRTVDEDEEIPMSARIAQDLYDEYESFQHECLVFIGASPKESLHSVVGICIYLLDRNVEYFCEAVPVDYLNYFKSKHFSPSSPQYTILAFAASI